MYLLDTNILLRIAQPGHAVHFEARQCVRALLRRKERIVLIPQVMFEFWVVATRPIDKNGLGLSIENVKRKLEGAGSVFDLIPDTEPIFREWLRIVAAYQVSGVKAHDARSVAAMNVHGVRDLVTFNMGDFKRYEGAEITVHAPASLILPSRADASE